MNGERGAYGIFNRLSIRHKLTLIIMGITAFSLATAMVIGLTSNYLIMQKEITERVHVMADLTARNLTSSLDFLDHESAGDVLQGLSYDNAVQGACVYDLFGSLFENFGKVVCAKTLEETEPIRELKKIRYDMPIVMSGNPVGTLQLFYSLTEARLHFLMTALISFIITLTALTLAYVITNVVQGVISRPVTELASAAHKFVSHKDFSIRVEKTTDDELGNMIQAFNNMVREMEERDRAIRRARDEAEKASDQARKASHMKSEFLANMSHELRTPLNSIIGLSKIMLEDGNLDGEETEMTGTIYKSASMLLDIVNDILDLSKIESGQIVLEKIGFDLKSIVAGVTEALAPIASKKGLSLNYNYSRENMPLLLGDPVRVSRILTNLVGNAVKYTGSGDVRIFIDYDLFVDGRVMIFCSVVDTGIGIAKDKLDIIFHKFSQADESTTRKFGGTGLGLAITRELVEMMGGKIGVSSSLGKGSTFWFKIPFEIADSIHDELTDQISEEVPRYGSTNRIPPEEARILIAEDYELNQVFIKKLLSRLGFQNYEIVENGMAAIKAFEANDYDLILMDCHMPDMNGYEATGKIRKIEKADNSHITIIALTADAMVGTRDKCIAAGMDDYISKPINSREFKNMMARWFVVSDEKSNSNVTGNVENVVDLSALKEYAETKEEMRSFCELFFLKTEEEVENLKGQCTDGTNDQWAEIAHKIKGSAGMIGALKLQSLCGKAQGMRISGLADRKKILEEIQDSYKQAKETLSREIA